ncbi:MAG: hypothetical protein HQ559_02590 [Lentisphaerae bacterium]|nr:hypothetical protein [Lentisphaerota bacterium]
MTVQTECAPKVAELDLVESAWERLQGVPGLSVCCDVPLLGRCVDLVYIRDGVLITVEFKLKAWRRAILQARDHRLGADHAYVCMPKRRVSEDMRVELEAEGVGLLFFSNDSEWPFETVVEAPASDDQWEVARRDVIEYVSINGVC